MRKPWALSLAAAVSLTLLFFQNCSGFNARSTGDGVGVGVADGSFIYKIASEFSGVAPVSSRFTLGSSSIFQLALGWGQGLLQGKNRV